jgi:hypothetical protein
VLHKFVPLCANLEALAALDEGVGDPEEPVMTEVQHAQELQVLKLASREDGGEVVTQLVVTADQGEQVQLKIFVVRYVQFLLPTQGDVSN